MNNIEILKIRIKKKSIFKTKKKCKMNHINWRNKVSLRNGYDGVEKMISKEENINEIRN